MRVEPRPVGLAGGLEQHTSPRVARPQRPGRGSSFVWLTRWVWNDDEFLGVLGKPRTPKKLLRFP